MKRIIFFLLFSPTFILAQPGSLDQSFGTSGISLSPYITQYSYAYGIAQQQDGKIVVTGYLEDNGLHTFITRYDTNGIVDTSFSNPILTIGQLGDYGRAITVQPDNKIIVAGFADNATTDISLVRRLPAGGSDTTFGTGGIVITDFGSNTVDHAHDVLLQPDGKILVTGWTSTNDVDIALLRYNSDGSPDSTFGTNGKVSTDIDSVTQEGNAIALQPDGKILVAGLTISVLNFYHSVVCRYMPDGSLDSSFGINGISVPPINVDDNVALDIVLQPDGKIVIAGYNFNIIPYGDVLLVRLDSLGNLDQTFGGGTGIVSFNSTNNDCYATGVMLQPDGKIITTGRGIDTTSNFMVTRFNSDGQVDSTFGTNGYVYTSVGVEEDYIYGSLLQADGKIVVAGYYSDNGLENFALARYNSDSSGFTSINENIMEEFIVYPQPAEESLHISLYYSKMKTENVQVDIFNITGQKLSSDYISKEGKSSLTVNCKFLHPGMYIIQVTSDGKVYRKKFLKE